MKYRGAGIKVFYILNIASLVLFGGMTMLTFVCCLWKKMYLALLLLLPWMALIDLFVLWCGKKFVRIVEIYENKIVFIPFILRNKRKVIRIEDIKQIRHVDELSLSWKKGFVFIACKFYDIDLKGDDKVYSIHPYRIQGSPKIDKIVEEVFGENVPIIPVDNIQASDPNWTIKL